MTTYQHLNVEKVVRVASPITGRSIGVLVDMQRALVPADACVETASAVYETVKNFRAVQAIARTLDANWTPASLHDICAFLDLVLTGLSERGAMRSGARRELVITAQRFVLSGTIALPPKYTTYFNVLWEPSYRHELGCMEDWVAAVVDAAAHTDFRHQRLPILVLRHACSSLGIRELGDMTVETVHPDVRRSLVRTGYGFNKAVERAQRERYGAALCAGAKRWTKDAFESTLDPAYRWVLEVRPDLEPWRAAWHAYWDRSKVKSNPLKGGRTFFKYLIAHPELPSTPEAYCARGYVNPAPFAEWLSTKQRTPYMINAVHRFFEDWISEKSSVGSDGYLARTHRYINPVPLLPAAKLASTVREILPSKYLRELAEILTENDYAFPRSLGTSHFPWLNPSTGSHERMWSPVATLALLVKLMLPLRTHQVRMLESDEGDPIVWRNGQWMEVQQPLHRYPRAFIRNIPDARGGPSVLGFFVNTNKTQDRMKHVRDRGYEIAWDRPDVRNVVEKLQSWQRTFNPLARPTRWEDIRDPVLQTRGKPDLRKLGEATFLFRDPCSSTPDQPIATKYLASLWIAALVELELRVEARGERHLDDSKITFVHRRQATRQSGAIQTVIKPRYTLHSLRASMITHLVVDAKVPVDIVARCIAGHARAVQSLYYVKMCAALVNDELKQAQAAVKAAEADNFELFREEQRQASAKPHIGSGDPFAAAIQHHLPDGWLVRSTGLCAVNGSRCSEVEQSLGKGSQVLLAQQPCVRCPYHISGPVFLANLIAEANRWSEQQSTAAKALVRVSNKILALEERCVTGLQGDAIPKLEQAHAARAALAMQFDAVHAQWSNIVTLAERCRQAHASDRVAFVCVGTREEVHSALAAAMDPSEKLRALVANSAWSFRPDAAPPSLTRNELLASLEGGQLTPLTKPLTNDEASVVGRQFGLMLSLALLPPALPSVRRSTEVSRELTTPLLHWAHEACTVPAQISVDSVKPKTRARRLLPAPTFSDDRGQP